MRDLHLLTLLAVLAHGACAASLAEDAAAPLRYRIAFATYLGGSEWEEAREVIALPDGTILVGAQTSSRDMPAVDGAFQRKYAGDDPASGHPGVFGGDCWLGRLAADGAKLLAATYLGGSKQERNVYGMERDRDGNVVIATATRSPDAPTTPGAFQPRYGGGPSDMLVAKVAPDLSRLIWCTYVGGSGDDFPRGGIALDASGNVVVVGTSSSSDFPTTPGVVGPALGGPRDSAVVKLRADGSALIFSTLLGGKGEDDAIMGARIGPEGEIHVAGHTKSADFPVAGDPPQPKLGGLSDAYLATLSADGTRILQATYLGGLKDEFAEHRPWLDGKGDFILAGFTASPDFPVTRWAVQKSLKGGADGFVARLSRNGDRFVFSTLLGGSGTDNWLGPVADPGGNIIVVGSTTSPDLPVTADALQPRLGGAEDGALVVLGPDGSEVLYATYLGGSGTDMIRSVTVGPAGELYLVGRTASEDFPVTEGAFQTRAGGKGDAFLVKLEGLPAFPAGEWVSLFDGKTLAGWKPFQDPEYPDMYGKVLVEDGKLVLEPGRPMTGVGWRRNIPRDGYEVSLEGMRVEGRDFFCGLTFPVGPSNLTLILGGWGGTVVGLSNIDGYSAVENQTTTGMTFENGRWYRIQLRVTPQRIEASIDGEEKIRLDRPGHEFTIWPQQEMSRPFGFTTYYTRGALRDIRLRSLP